MRLIDADALPIWHWTMAWEEGVGIRRCLEAIDRAPTIDPVKHGRWVKIEGLSSDYYCSECEQKWWTPFPEEMHYCPHCGARMVDDETN